MSNGSLMPQIISKISLSKQSLALVLASLTQTQTTSTTLPRRALAGCSADKPAAVSVRSRALRWGRRSKLHVSWASSWAPSPSASCRTSYPQEHHQELTIAVLRHLHTPDSRPAKEMLRSTTEISSWRISVSKCICHMIICKRSTKN